MGWCLYQKKCFFLAGFNQYGSTGFLRRGRKQKGTQYNLKCIEFVFC